MGLDWVQRIAEWLEPASHHNILVFLCFANYYKHFISSFLQLKKPMINMPKGVKNGSSFVPLYLPGP